MTTLDFRTKARKLVLIAFFTADILFIAVAIKTIITILDAQVLDSLASQTRIGRSRRKTPARAE
jgi:hypothetical protein